MQRKQQQQPRQRNRVVVVQATGGPSARTLRNRRRRQRQRSNRLANTIPPLVRQPGIRQSSRNSLLTLAGFEQKDIVRGTEKLLDTLFVSTHGRSRGLSVGTEPSALVSVKGFIDITVPAGGFVNLAVLPIAPSQANFIVTSTVAPGGASVPGGNPFATGTGVTYAATAGPWVSGNPANAGRPVGFHIMATPTTNVLNQGGYVNACHIPALYNASIPGGGTYTGPLTSLSLENQAMQRTFTGLETIRYNWFPSPNEIEFIPMNFGSATGPFSGFYATFVNPGGASTIYHVEYMGDYEILPSDAFVSLLDKQPATIHPNAYYHITQFVLKHWSPFVLGTMPEWLKAVSKIDPVTHDMLPAYALSSQVGIPSRSAIYPLHEEEKLMDEGIAANDFMDQGEVTTSGSITLNRQRSVLPSSTRGLTSGWRNYY